MAKFIVGSLFWAVGIAIFYGIFFLLTPFITRMVPPSEWAGLIKIAIYVIIGYLGGIGLPLVFIVVGVLVWAGRFDD